jgi:hypothetical protein
MSIVLCFRMFPQVDSDDVHTLTPKHIQEVLARVVTKRPDLARHLILDPESPSGLRIQAAPPRPVIPCECLLPPDFIYKGPSFSELEAQNFPAAAFVDPEFIISGDINPSSGPKPVVRIRLLYIKDGLLMFTYMHHAYGDGSCLDDFVTLLSSEMVPNPKSNTLVNNQRIDVDFDIGSDKKDRDFQSLVQKCPEYALFSEPLGPTQPVLEPVDLDMASYKKPMTGKIFVVRSATLRPVLNWLKESYDGKPISSFLAIRALIWAHTTKARLAYEDETSALFANHKPKFTNPHNWNDPGKNLFPTNNSLKTYFGNGVAIASVTLPNADVLLNACDWKTAMEQGEAPTALLEVIRQIDQANRAIDEEFVLTRTALFESAPDIRHIGVAHDARAPHTFSCNTWKFLGGRATFMSPDEDEGVRCSAIRRAQGEWALPHALVLPGRPAIGDGDLELLVTLPEMCMKALEEDEDWMGLIDTSPA